MRAFFEDVRYCVRSLRRSPGFTLVVILTLGLGIGFNTAIYSVVNSFILRPLPVKDPDQLVILAARDKHAEVPHGVSFPDYRDYRNLTGETPTSMADFVKLHAAEFTQPPSSGTGP